MAKTTTWVGVIVVIMISFWGISRKLQKRKRDAQEWSPEEPEAKYICTERTPNSPHQDYNEIEVEVGQIPVETKIEEAIDGLTIQEEKNEDQTNEEKNDTENPVNHAELQERDIQVNEHRDNEKLLTDSPHDQEILIITEILNADTYHQITNPPTEIPNTQPEQFTVKPTHLETECSSQIIIPIQQEMQSIKPSHQANKRISIRKPTGLVNIGNTCYMNSALQCLFSVVAFRNYFLQNDEDIGRRLGKTSASVFTKGKLCKEYKELTKKMARTSDASTRAIKATVASYAPQFADFSQHDSIDFISNLLAREIATPFN